VAQAAFAQVSEPTPWQVIAQPTRTTTYNRNYDDNDYGWLGLLGLAGLVRLAEDAAAPVVHHHDERGRILP
jgi:hypothetical protein